MMITTILFDADVTLYEEKHAKIAGETAVVKEASKMAGLDVYKTWGEFQEAKKNILTSQKGDPLRVERTRWIEEFLRAINVSDSESAKLADLYWENVLAEIRPYADAIANLPKLVEKYKLVVVTNEIAEFAEKKLQISGFLKYMSQVVSSSTAGCEKPGNDIFGIALASVQATPEQAVMVGNDPRSDITGANAYGITSIFLKRGPFTRYKFITEEETPTHAVGDYFSLLDVVSKI